ncbi:MAG: DPP IV N-terminal domain-containing protein [Bacteroidales bacterium]|nr:DPP IV N-terminal domain-containing protein [Bacteroidales bacterium]
MNKSIFILSLCLLLISNRTFSQTVNGSIELRELWGSRKFVPKSISDNVPMNSDEHYSVLENSYQINEYEYRSGEKTRTIINFRDVFLAAELQPKAIDEYVFNKDETKVLVATETDAIYRHSTASEYYVYDLGTERLVSLSELGKQRLATFSPDGTKIAYVIENNIYIKDLITLEEVQVTNDGEYNEVINGATDWVYEEEFSFTQAFFWSPDGQKIAFYRFDESHVKEFVMMMYGTLYPEEYRYKYPKAGEENAHVSIHIYNVPLKSTTLVDIGTEEDQYIPRIKWSKDPNKLAVLRMNRLQNHLELLFADARTGVTNRVYEENNRCYIEINDHLTFTDDGQMFIISSEKNGYNHLYCFDMNGNLINQITNGEWDVIDVAGYNSENKTLYYISTEDSPVTRHVYAININGTKKVRLSQNAGYNNPTFSKKFKYFINQYSNINTPPVYTVNNSRNGNEIRLIEGNSDLKRTMKELDIAQTEFIKIPTENGILLNAWMIKPHDFDDTKKYPVLFYVYGGPGSQTVQDEWGGHNHIWFQMMAQQGYIVVSVDNRGTPGRGEAFKKATYLQLGLLETIDQIEAAKFLGTLPYVDKDRIGIFGWSYGGYLTLLCMTKGASYFKTGIAVAPVTNWRFYDSIYTERYMGLPKDNASGYDDNSPINHVDKLIGKLLIVHGSADDNVHYQNSMEIFNALVNANKPFDMHIYPDKNHGIYGGYTRLHLFSKMTAYLIENL